MSELIRRVAAAEEVLARFGGQPFAWGRFDCARLAAATLKAMGHTVSMAKFGLYSSEIGALRALKRQGFADLGQVLDSMNIPRIPPASALPADLVAMPAESFGGLSMMVALGNGRLLGFGGGPCTVLRPLTPPPAAWRL